MEGSFGEHLTSSSTLFMNTRLAATPSGQTAWMALMHKVRLRRRVTDGKPQPCSDLGWAWQVKLRARGLGMAYAWHTPLIWSHAGSCIIFMYISSFHTSLFFPSYVPHSSLTTPSPYFSPLTIQGRVWWGWQLLGLVVCTFSSHLPHFPNYTITCSLHRKEYDGGGSSQDICVHSLQYFFFPHIYLALP